MTERTYYKKPYETSWEAAVTAVIPYKKQWGITLDSTLCYPEGGGQPGDQGSCGPYSIITTIKQDDEVLHLVSVEPDLKIGDTVACSIDWAFRYDYMQQHTGQHILSGVMYRELGIDTVSVHQGEVYTTIEVDQDDVTPAEIEQIEKVANEMINRNLEIWCDEKSDEEFDPQTLRRAPKVKGLIRLVTIDDCDIVACGGIHTKRTGEVGLISCIGVETIRGRVRLVFKIGERAYQDYREKNTVIAELSNLYSAKQHEIVSQAKQKVEQIKELQSQLTNIEKQYAHKLIKSALATAEGYEGVRILALDITGEPSGILKTISKSLPEDDPFVLCLLQDNSPETVQWLIAAGGDTTIDFNKIRSELFPLIGAKGGGRAPLWQGVGTNLAGKETFLEAFLAIQRG